jgi:hypothetical protein
VVIKRSNKTSDTISPDTTITDELVLLESYTDCKIEGVDFLAMVKIHSLFRPYNGISGSAFRNSHLSYRAFQWIKENAFVCVPIEEKKLANQRGFKN